MELWLDTADLDEVSLYSAYGVIRGVTTNPSIMKKDGVEPSLKAGAAQARWIAEHLNGRSYISVEVMTDNPEDMIGEAESLETWYHDGDLGGDCSADLLIKIPITTSDGAMCLDVVHELAKRGVKTNVTACMTVNQYLMAVQAGATVVSLFSGRILDEGNDPNQVIADCRLLYDRNWDPLMDECPGRIVVGSIRHQSAVAESFIAGAHIVTVPPSIMAKMCRNARTMETVADFVEAAKG